jgi:hypothetical protein
MFKFKLFFLILFISIFSFAEVDYSLNSYLFFSKNQISESIINPSNSILKAPSDQADLDVRAELKWKSDLDRIILRPRFTAYYKSYAVFSDISETELKAKVDLTDAFYEKYWSPKLSTTFGLQVYQWGPAELLNPSNPFYHFSTQQRAVYFKEKGKALLRMNYSYDRENSLVLIAEPISNAEPEWIAESQFNSKFLAKYEKIFSGTSNQIGFVVGTEEKNNFFLGQYFSMTFADSLSFYADVKESKNKLNYMPKRNGTHYDLVFSDSHPIDWSTLGVLGIRWEEEFDARLEFVHNGAGFDRHELNQAIFSASDYSNPNYRQNLERFRRIGLEFFGKSYTYFSIRKSDPLEINDLNIFFRNLFSLQDSSGLFQFEADYSLFDSWQILTHFNFINGNSNSEFRLSNDWQFLMGVKWGI